MRDAEKVIAKRFLFASGLCFSLNALILIKASVIDGVTALPIPPFVIFIILAIASFYVSKKIRLKEAFVQKGLTQFLKPILTSVSGFFR